MLILWWIHFRFKLVYFRSEIRVKHIDNQNSFFLSNFVFVAIFKLTMSITCLNVQYIRFKWISQNDDEENCKFSFHSKSTLGSRISTLIDAPREIHYCTLDVNQSVSDVGLSSLYRELSTEYFCSSRILHTVLVNFLFKFFYFTVKCVQNPDTEPSKKIRT